jgi:hypothetical protein
LKPGWKQPGFLLRYTQLNLEANLPEYKVKDTDVMQFGYSSRNPPGGLVMAYERLWQKRADALAAMTEEEKADVMNRFKRALGL